MKVTQAGVTVALTFLASVASMVLPLLVQQNVISAGAAAIVGGIVTAVVSSWHGNNAVTKLQARRQVAISRARGLEGPVKL